MAALPPKALYRRFNGRAFRLTHTQDKMWSLHKAAARKRLLQFIVKGVRRRGRGRHAWTKRADGPLYTELFPTRVRGGGQGFCYNFGRGLASIFPTLVGLLSTRLPLGAAIGAFAVGAYLLMIAAAMLLPETRGRELDAVGA
jgi:hypothetical protein